MLELMHLEKNGNEQPEWAHLQLVPLQRQLSEFFFSKIADILSPGHNSTHSSMLTSFKLLSKVTEQEGLRDLPKVDIWGGDEVEMRSLLLLNDVFKGMRIPCVSCKQHGPAGIT